MQQESGCLQTKKQALIRHQSTGTLDLDFKDSPNKCQFSIHPVCGILLQQRQLRQVVLTEFQEFCIYSGYKSFIRLVIRKYMLRV